MLSADHRLTRPTSFRHAVKAGRRAGGRNLVTHLAVAEGQADEPARVGFVVSRAVGNAVVRNRVKRRLRHAARARISLLPGGTLLVVRAQPPAAAASYEELAAELDRCLGRSLEVSSDISTDISTVGSGRVER
ncbi:ribonuclease P protein component [Nocardioides sp. HM23]|uniref:ribonuclease P protein component n=1 Tax=Nocardioides bizhenqiangii TaxID=3095076 RepID=UPI002ACA478E|nr:ribonuclease P protein component [Nocardioides sp. HM23]MDZ5619349.1 ribonuclease P protein component [Nocardioides sp. HM23]